MKLTKKILILEDDEGIIDAMSIILKEAGYKVHSFSKGNHVVEKIIEFSPDLIILDVLLSGTDGREICAQIKKNEKTASIPIVMCSAHPSIKDSVLKCGADEFLPKPFDMDELLDVASKYTG